jgi:hypothetical protein
MSGLVSVLAFRRSAGSLPRVLAGAAAALASIYSLPAHALDCSAVTAAIAGRVQDLRCIDSPDLTTQNPDTTPLDNSRADLPPLAFTPRTDRAAIVPDVSRTPIVRAVPGLQITGAMADDDGARFVIRLPHDDFTGRVIVGVPAATRSEYTGDFFLSDLVVQRGDAYVMSNKGAYNLRLTSASDPQGCALAPPGVPAAGVFVRAFRAAARSWTTARAEGRPSSRAARTGPRSAARTRAPRPAARDARSTPAAAARRSARARRARSRTPSPRSRARARRCAARATPSCIAPCGRPRRVATRRAR